MIQTQTENSFPAQLARIQQATGIGTQMELAELLRIRQSAISSARRAGKIPAEWLLTLLRVKNIFPEWILTGHGPIFVPRAEHEYETEADAREAELTALSLQRLSARALADELVRRIAVAEQAAFTR